MQCLHNKTFDISSQIAINLFQTKILTVKFKPSLALNFSLRPPYVAT